MRRETVEVLIVGAGPSGSALACLLAESGLEVAVLDRSTFPRPKPCGEFVNPGAVRVLRRLGLELAVSNGRHSRIHGWEVLTEGSAAAWGRYHLAAPFGLGISRQLFDSALIKEARRRGARIIEGVRVVDFTDRGAHTRPVVKTVASGLRCDWDAPIVVGADGLRSIIARRAGLVRRRPRLRKFSFTYRLRGKGPSRDSGSLYLTTGGTVGLAPVSGELPLWNGTIVISEGSRSASLVSSPKETFRRALLSAAVGWEEDGPEIIDGPWTSGPFDWPMRAAVADGVVLVGDAAGFYDPLTGQGIYQALRTAELAAPVIEDALETGRTTTQYLERYSKAVRWELRGTRAIQRGVEFVVSHARLREFAISRLAAGRRFADRLIQTVGDSATIGSLAFPLTLSRS